MRRITRASSVAPLAAGCLISLAACNSSTDSYSPSSTGTYSPSSPESAAIDNIEAVVGTYNDPTTDTNNDGIQDAAVFDTNGDGVGDTIGSDINGDGVVDTALSDNNGDGVFDAIALDRNIDGYLETVAFDTNVDGRWDTAGIDADRNGVLDDQSSLNASVAAPDPGGAGTSSGGVDSYMTSQFMTGYLQSRQDAIEVIGSSVSEWEGWG